jgi:transposase
LVDEDRLKNGRQKDTSFVIVDAQSVKNTESAQNKGYDAGKKISGIKRHILVDSTGLPHAIIVTPANVTDRQGAIYAILANKRNLKEVKVILADGGYTGKPFAQNVKNILEAEIQIAKRNELHTFAVIPKRWIVERSFSWLEKCHRLWKNCERKLHTSQQMISLAFIRILLKRL